MLLTTLSTASLNVMVQYSVYDMYSYLFRNAHSRSFWLDRECKVDRMTQGRLNYVFLGPNKVNVYTPGVDRPVFVLQRHDG
jgi:hypothetical protein